MNVDVQRLLLLDVFVQGQVVQGHGQHPARRHGGNEFRRELDVVALFRLEGPGNGHKAAFQAG